MIQIKCTAPDTVTLGALTPFQGDLKKRTSRDLDALILSILTEGLLMPLAVWQTGDKLMILDGHGRYAALARMALTDASIITQELPVIRVNAPDEETARKALLQITSSYGKISGSGIAKFMVSIPNYKAPVVSKVHLHTEKVKATAPTSDMVIVRLRVPKDMVQKLTPLLKQLDGVEIY
jgi:hypothetical protein